MEHNKWNKYYIADGKRKFPGKIKIKDEKYTMALWCLAFPKK